MGQKGEEGGRKEQEEGTSICQVPELIFCLPSPPLLPLFKTLLHNFWPQLSQLFITAFLSLLAPENYLLVAGSRTSHSEIHGVVTLAQLVSVSSMSSHVLRSGSSAQVSHPQATCGHLQVFVVTSVPMLVVPCATFPEDWGCTPASRAWSGMEPRS